MSEVSLYTCGQKSHRCVHVDTSVYTHVYVKYVGSGSRGPALCVVVVKL